MTEQLESRFGPAKEMYEKTESEEVFEHYLSSQSLTWARISLGAFEK